MDLLKAIRELHEEKKRLDAAISSLELMLAAEARLPALRVSMGRKRGRKSMSREEREQVSERMKKYWAARRGAAAEAEEPPAKPSEPSVNAA